MSKELIEQQKRIRKRMIGRAIAQVVLAPIYCITRPALIIAHVLTAFLNPWWWLAAIIAYHFSATSYSVLMYLVLAWILMVLTATQDVMEKHAKSIIIEGEGDSATLGNMFGAGLLVATAILALFHKFLG